MRSTSSSEMAWKIADAPPRSTISSASSAALSTVGGTPRPSQDRGERPALERVVEAAGRDLRCCAGSPPPRSLRILSLTTSRMRARWAGSASRSRRALCPPSSAQAGKSAALQRGARGRVGVLVDRDVDAALARLRDQPQRLGAPAPGGAADHLVVRDLRRKPALLADRDRLADAVEDTRRLVPHVRDVDAAELARRRARVRPPRPCARSCRGRRRGPC